MDFVLQWISTYGYAAIYLLLMLGIVGLPIPDETLLVFCGYLISKGHLNPVATFAVALAGSATGITVSYILGRTLGLGVIHRWGRYLHVTQERLDLVHRWFDRAGHWTLVFGYYFAGVRHFTAIVAGTSGLKPLSFALFAYCGATMWVTTFLTLGYHLGENWATIAAAVHHYVVIGSIVVIVASAGYWWYRRRKADKLTSSQGRP